MISVTNTRYGSTYLVMSDCQSESGKITIRLSDHFLSNKCKHKDIKDLNGGASSFPNVSIKSHTLFKDNAHTDEIISKIKAMQWECQNKRRTLIVVEENFDKKSLCFNVMCEDRKTRTLMEGYNVRGVEAMLESVQASLKKWGEAFRRDTEKKKGVLIRWTQEEAE